MYVSCTYDAHTHNAYTHDLYIHMTNIIQLALALYYHSKIIITIVIISKNVAM